MLEDFAEELCVFCGDEDDRKKRLDKKYKYETTHSLTHSLAHSTSNTTRNQTTTGNWRKLTKRSSASSSWQSSFD